ncbi:MAG: ATP-binding protein, partial [Aggregatilineales bacterium]
VVGRTDFDFFPENEASQFFRIENSIMMDDIPVINSQRDHIDQNGTLSSMLVSKFPLMDTDKNVIGLIGVQRDISELRQAQDYLMRVLESARCLLWYATVEDNGGTYVWDLHIANEEAAAAFLPVAQESDDYTVGWLASIFPEDHIKRQRMLETNLKYNRSYSLELRCLQLDQSVRWLVEDVQIKSATPGRWNLVGICTDITERKTAEKKLQSAHDTLELRVGERTRELLRTNETLQQEINERRRAEDAERKQRILAEALRDSSVAINQHIEIGTALDELLGTLTSVVPHDGSMITLLNEDVLRIVGRYGQTINMGNIEISISTMSNLQQILATRESLAIDDVTRYEGWITLAGEEWIRANLVIPIVLDDEIVGFLHLNSRYPGRFTRQDVTHLEGFASQVSIAIRNERLMDEIHQHAADLEVRVDARTADLTQKTAELEAILNAMRDGVVYYDLDAVPQYINWAMSDITQFSNEMWLSGQAEQAMLYIPPDDEDEDIVLVEHPRETILDRRGKLMLERQGFWQRDMLLQREDGSLFDAGVTWAEVRDDTNARIGMVMVLRDISEPKQLEKQKKQFIASASHELRTPITNMKTRLYLMRRQPERFDEHIEVAESVVNWMSHLVETMFDISRFEQGVIVLQHEQFVLQDLLMDVYNDHFPAASNAHVDLSYVMPEDAIDYIADRSRMRQVLTNLVSNALYYTSENGFVRIELVHDESNIYIRVIDNGAGIPEESQARLFEPFYRAHDNNKGAGLGLSIANDIV